MPKKAKGKGKEKEQAEEEEDEVEEVREWRRDGRLTGEQLLRHLLSEVPEFQQENRQLAAQVAQLRAEMGAQRSER